MTIKLKHTNTYSTWFVTFTCVEWIPLIEMINTCDIVYKWFGVLKNEYHADAVAYVIMPNHLHVILHLHNEHFDLNKIIANGNMAYEIVKRLKAAGNTNMLDRLKNLIAEREKRKGQLHKIFKDSFDAKAIFTQSFLLQKINYIHNNPVTGKWMLAKDFVEYENSGASFYEIQLVLHFSLCIIWICSFH